MSLIFILYIYYFEKSWTSLQLHALLNNLEIAQNKILTSLLIGYNVMLCCISKELTNYGRLHKYLGYYHNVESKPLSQHRFLDFLDGNLWCWSIYRILSEGFQQCVLTKLKIECIWNNPRKVLAIESAPGHIRERKISASTMNGICKTETDHPCQQISSIEELHMFVLQESSADILTCKIMMAFQEICD